MYILCGTNHVMNGKATYKQHIERDKVRYGKAVLSQESSLLSCCQVGGRPSVSQTSNTPNQETSASTSSLTRSRYPQFQISWRKTKLMAVTANPTNHLPLKICNMEVQFVDSFTYIGSMITNDGCSSRDITYCIAKAASAMCRLSNPLFRKHHISIQEPISICIALSLSP